MGKGTAPRYTRLGLEVALKFLPASFDYDPDRHARFLREARAASGPALATRGHLRHRRARGQSFIVMEYVEGELLARRIARGPLPGARRDRLRDAGSPTRSTRPTPVASCTGHQRVANLIVTARGSSRSRLRPSQVCRKAGGRGRQPLAHARVRPKETVAGAPRYRVLHVTEQALGAASTTVGPLFARVVLYECSPAPCRLRGGATEIIDRIVHDEPPALARFNYEVPADLDHIGAGAREGTRVPIPGGARCLHRPPQLVPPHARPGGQRRVRGSGARAADRPNAFPRRPRSRPLSIDDREPRSR